MSKKIHETLDLNPSAGQYIPPTELVVFTDPPETTQDQIAADFDYARDNLYDIIEQSKAAMAEMFEVARQSQHPKVYESMTTMLKITADTNKALLELHKAKKELSPAASGDQAPTTINNNLFLTTEELNKMLEDARALKEQ